MPLYTRNFGKFILKLIIGVLEVLRKSYLLSIKNLTSFRDTFYIHILFKKINVVNKSNFDNLKIRKN